MHGGRLCGATQAAQLGGLHRSARRAIDAGRGARGGAHVAPDRERHWQPRQPAEPADRSSDPLSRDRRAPGRSGGNDHPEVLEARARRDAAAACPQPGPQLGAVGPKPAL
eukprot:2046448-Lingulodinium_polyedra.AAC.1